MKPLAIAYSLQHARGGRNHFWTKLLARRYTVEVVEDFAEADLFFYSDRGKDHQRFSGRKIYYTGENMLPDYNECDFAITSSYRPDDTRHYRVPYYVFALKRPEALLKGPEYDAERILRSKTGFCCFVASNPRAPERNQFFKILNCRRRVDSGGRHFNNIGGPVKNKVEFAARYKFVMAFENTLYPGYTTEKLTEAMLAGGVPIYWGNPEVGREFNVRSFINASDFPDFTALAQHVLRVDADDALYLKYLREPWFVENRIPEVFRMDLLLEAVANFIDSGRGPGPRQYRTRHLREHVYTSPTKRSWVSMKCRLESALWKIGLRG